MLDANGTPGTDTIEFNIPGPGVHTIAPLSALPSITGKLELVQTVYDANGNVVETIGPAVAVCILVAVPP